MTDEIERAAREWSEAPGCSYEGFLAGAAFAEQRANGLVEALGYYADSYSYGDGNGMSWESTSIEKDRGDKARTALQKWRGDGKAES